MATLLGQLSQPLQAVRDHLREGGSVASVILVLLGIAVIVLLVGGVARQQAERQGTRTLNDPRRLFSDLLRQLPLDQQQRKFLDTLAAELRLEHPAAILLSPTLFDSAVAKWKRDWGPGRKDLHQTAASIRAFVFQPAGGQGESGVA